jgi:hypothetical protein
MQRVLAELHGSRPLVLTVVAYTETEGGGGGLVQLTVSGRAPGRVYRRDLDAEEINGHERHRPDDDG